MSEHRISNEGSLDSSSTVFARDLHQHRTSFVDYARSWTRSRHRREEPE